MAGGKETPRQKMIGMMYLVLTALLALNVSKEILDAFITINNGLETTKVAFDGKLEGQYAGFQAAYNENKVKYGKAWEQAQALRITADELVKHIDLIKAKTIAVTEGKTMEEVLGKNAFGHDTVLNLTFVNSKDNYDVNTNIMVGAEPDTPLVTDHEDGNNYRAAVLKQKLVAYGVQVKEMAKGNPGLEATIDSLFTYPEVYKDASGTNTNWESLNFYHVPIAATTAILSKLQSDVRNAQADVLGFLFSGVDAKSYKFTELQAIVVPQKTYVLEGDSFRADVFLAAYDNTNLPEIVLAPLGTKIPEGAEEIGSGAKIIPIGADGFGKLRLPAQGVGEKSWEGLIKFRKPEGGGYNTYTYNIEYEVARPSLVVSPTKMNVLYRGIENPVAISVPGVPQQALTATLSNGTLTKQADGSYIAKVNSGSEAIVSVTAEINGVRKSMGTFPFRLKSVPDPVAKFAGKYSTDNTAKPAELTAALGLIAELKDFVFDLSYPIKSFDITLIRGADVKTLQSSSNKITPDQSEMLRQVRRNDVISIENIRANAPDGTVRKLGGINLRVI